MDERGKQHAVFACCSTTSPQGTQELCQRGVGVTFLTVFGEKMAGGTAFIASAAAQDLPSMVPLSPTENLFKMKPRVSEDKWKSISPLWSVERVSNWPIAGPRQPSAL